jgi:DNA-binding XRE family transcriptional regulator
VPTRTPAKKRHVVHWIRTEVLGLTQAEFGSAVDASWHTVQAWENGSLPLSHRFAVAIKAKTGISAQSLLRNKLSPRPDPATIRACFKRRQYFGSDSYYSAHLGPRYVLLKLYVLHSAIANELGDDHGWLIGPGKAGFFDILRKADAKLLECIPNRRIRRQVYSEAAAIVKEGVEKVTSLVISHAQELQRVSRERKKKATRPQPAGEASSASPPSQKGSRSAPAPAGDGQGQSPASPSAQGRRRRLR